MRFSTGPEADEKLAAKQRENARELRQAIGDELELDGLPGQRRGRKKALRLNYYPPVAIDAELFEWFARRAGDSTSMAFAINRVLLDYVDALESKRQKKAG